MTLIIIFWISVLALIHTYLLFPGMLRLLAGKKKPNNQFYGYAREIPSVSVIMAVHNEQEVLAEKVESILANELYVDNLEILVGSDASTDNTGRILSELALSIDCLKFVLYDKRMGKSAIINELAAMAEGELLLITDANVIFGEDCIYHLMKHFRNGSIGLVDSNMKHKALSESGISVQENAYISREVRIKYHEGLVWGTMMGPFGGCYAIRKELYSNVPPRFLVDDFFINMKVLSSGYKSVIEPEAIVYEDVSNSLAEEFRRKARIAAGNFQNLRHFYRSLLSPVPGLSVCFLSHKVLRWFGPFFLTAIFISSFLLGRDIVFYRYLFFIQLFILILPIIDLLLGKIKIHIIILRFITHFISMNFALLAGFIKFLKGVKTNVWQPTRRNQ